jgi:hypothetical protein
MQDLDSVIAQLMDEQGWTVHTVLDLLVNHLNADKRRRAAAIRYLLRVAREENEQSESIEF